MTKQAIQEIKNNIKPISSKIPGAKFFNEKMKEMVDDFILTLGVVENEKASEGKARISHADMKKRLQLS